MRRRLPHIYETRDLNFCLRWLRGIVVAVGYANSLRRDIDKTKRRCTVEASGQNRWFEPTAHTRTGL